MGPILKNNQQCHDALECASVSRSMCSLGSVRSIASGDCDSFFRCENLLRHNKSNRLVKILNLKLVLEKCSGGSYSSGVKCTERTGSEGFRDRNRREREALARVKGRQTEGAKIWSIIGNSLV